MEKVGIREFKRDASKILRRVREEGETFEVTYHGKAIARLTPVEESVDRAMTVDEFFEAWDALPDADDASLPEGHYAVEAVRESRRRIE